MKYLFHFLVTLIVLIVMTCYFGRRLDYSIPEEIEPIQVIYSGVRSSSYGIRPFPEPEEWKFATEKMSSFFPGSMPCAIWIVGKIKNHHSCLLEFTGDSSRFQDIEFIDNDKHEKYLSYFDSVGIKVFLQVEPGNADVLTLIDLVLNRYQHHECVIGFGVDVEWFRESEKRGWGVPLKNEEAKCWEARIKYYNKKYQLFLKHWDRNWMPKTYRGDILFISDSQMLKSFNKMLDEFSIYWADYFYPNQVGYQIGYQSDKKWWEVLNIPPRDIGVTIAKNIKQPCSIFWVDFTLREVLSENREWNEKYSFLDHSP